MRLPLLCSTLVILGAAVAGPAQRVLKVPAPYATIQAAIQAARNSDTVLVGPGAVSSGDQVALRLALHPKARLFGKSTNTAFNAAALMIDEPEWQATFAFADAYLLSNPGEYLTHDLLPVDHPVWLTQEAVAAGRDTVVEAAIAWIRDVEFAPRRPSGRLTP